MREMTNGAESFHALVVTVAGDTIIFDKFLVKGDVLFFFFDSQAFSGYFADLLYLVAVDALCGWAADSLYYTQRGLPMATNAFRIDERP